MERVAFGVSGLDEMVGGGIPLGSAVEISGVPGSGKTILALHFLLEGAKSGEKGLLVSSEQARQDICQQLESLGLKLPEGVGVLHVESERSGLRLDKFVKQIASEAKKLGAKRLVIDSISSFISLLMTPAISRQASEAGERRFGATVLMPLFVSDEPVVRSVVWNLFAELKKIGCTTVLTSELPKDSSYFSRDTISEFKADGIILLEPVEVEGQSRSIIRIAKMRYTDHERAGRLFSISKGGVKVSAWHKVEER